MLAEHLKDAEALQPLPPPAPALAPLPVLPPTPPPSVSYSPMRSHLSFLHDDDTCKWDPPPSDGTCQDLPLPPVSGPQPFLPSSDAMPVLPPVPPPLAPPPDGGVAVAEIGEPAVPALPQGNSRIVSMIAEHAKQILWNGHDHFNGRVKILRVAEPCYFLIVRSYQPYGCPHAKKDL
jgi:hypothetical protein